MERAETARTVSEFVRDQVAATGVDPEVLAGLAGTSEAKIRSLDPDPDELAERRERHGAAWATALDAAAKEESP